MENFERLGVRPSLLESLKELNISRPTEIQNLVIPLLLEGRDVVAVAETGSGKTLAYALPLIQSVKAREERFGVQKQKGQPWGLVIAPTRELADQIGKVLKQLTHRTRLRVRILNGAFSILKDASNAGQEFEIAIVTPGRLLKLINMEALNVAQTRFVVLDEADQLMEMGFFYDIQFALSLLPSTGQRCLFTATMPEQIEKLVKASFPKARLIQTSQAHNPVKTVKARQISVSNNDKLARLELEISRTSKKAGIIFANTRERCQMICDVLLPKGYPVSLYHGEMMKLERKQNLKQFRAGNSRILVSTDIASRGLDVAQVDWIINFDLPKTTSAYLHRIGRTARMGRSGSVINFVTPMDEKIAAKIENNQKSRTPFKLVEAPQYKKSKPDGHKGDRAPRPGRMNREIRHSR